MFVPLFELLHKYTNPSAPIPPKLLYEKLKEIKLIELLFDIKLFVLNWRIEHSIIYTIFDIDNNIAIIYEHNLILIYDINYYLYTNI